MRRFIVSAGVAAVVIVAGVTAALASDGSDNRRLEVTATQTSAAMIEPAVGFVGTRFVGVDALTVDSQAAGRGARSCEVVADVDGSGNATFLCLVTLTLPRGTLTLQAAPILTERGMEAVRAAVTGGTGDFRHARGEALMQEITPTQTRYTLDLR